MAYDVRQLYKYVRDAAVLGTDEEAASVTRHVLSGISRVIPGELCLQLAAALPAELGNVLRTDCGPDSLIDRQAFIGPLVHSMSTMYGYDQSLGGIDLISVYLDDDAVRQVQAVFAGLRQMLDSSLLQQIAQHLPPEVADWWHDAAGSPPPNEF